jgi:hypothetical protein
MRFYARVSNCFVALTMGHFCFYIWNLDKQQKSSISNALNFKILAKIVTHKIPIKSFFYVKASKVATHKTPLNSFF